EMTAARVEIPAHRTIAMRVRHRAANSMGGPQIPSSCCRSPAATDSTCEHADPPASLHPTLVCRYCVDGVEPGASPVAGKGARAEPRLAHCLVQAAVTNRTDGTVQSPGGAARGWHHAAPYTRRLLRPMGWS